MNIQGKLSMRKNVNYIQILIVFLVILLLYLISYSQNEHQFQSTDSLQNEIEGSSFRLERAYLVTLHVPNADVDRVLKAVADEVGLYYGNYDQVAYLDASGIEQYRPIEGSKAGVQDIVSREPTTRVHFSVKHDLDILNRALRAAHSAHSYEEPVFYICEVWRSRMTDSDDSNPNRWWNQDEMDRDSTDSN